MTATAAAPAFPRARRTWSSPGWVVGQAAVTFLIVWALLGGTSRNWRVPIYYSTDALEYLMQAKTTIERGWWWTQPRLGAPGTFDQVAYPSETNVEQAVVWVVRLVTRDAGLALNVSWLVLVVLSGIVASAGFGRLGVSRATAAAAGIVYAITPYALMRNVEHFGLAIYLVPVPCVAALLIATRRLPPLRSRTTAILTAGCVLLGFDYIYYPFFATFLLLVACGVAAVSAPRDPAWRRGAVVIAVLLSATLVNTVPSLVNWSSHGQPLTIPDKSAAESEIYGLKLRQLVSPVPDHPLPIFARWNVLEARAKFPDDNENRTARLGLIGTAGFLVLVGALLAPGFAARLPNAPIMSAAAGLTLALVVLGTTGGFGSLFALLVTPAIRSYDRVCPFVTFFALMAVAVLCDRGIDRVGSAYRAGWSAVTAIALVGVAMWDQGGAVDALNRGYAASRDEWTAVGAFVSDLEHRLPSGARVFELPISTYLMEDEPGRMAPYDPIKLYLPSTSIHWSYPSLDNAVVRWQHAVARLPPPSMAAALRAAGFAAVVIDRRGYPDGGDAIETALTAPGTDGTLASSARYVALDLSRAPATAASVQLPTWPATFDAATAGVGACATAMASRLDSIGPIKLSASAPTRLEPASTFIVRGWAIDDAHEALAGDVDVVIDGRPYPTFYGINRPDVSARSGPGYQYSGFLTHVPGSALAAGRHELHVRALSADRRCYADGTPMIVDR